MTDPLKGRNLAEFEQAIVHRSARGNTIGLRARQLRNIQARLRGDLRLCPPAHAGVKRWARWHQNRDA